MTISILIMGLFVNKAVSIYQKKYHIKSNDVDFNKKLKLGSLFGYFQEIVSMHAGNLGVGVKKKIIR